ncbi:right-handed parallel beta-helix repeat-containing protein [Chelativorans salis]|uniref:Right-handed parallel beta-helix repeat-containing protein n=1 Tax=Chelativorans salis TaxID=2978478 RepID=A0ABT2LJB0_9HYPH|nr:right-handed parallel beta-helix repeat-containing protein [Chelativorans sp. EGI FJ00035]MCT7374677.1 right-handed parallel beta-helix repeat-containing protein [Chelativorans sp. EGI FJ00035]
MEGVPGGAPTIGIINDKGRYTAPANVHGAVDVTVTAASANGSGESKSWAVCNELFVRPGDTHHVATIGFDSAQGTSDAPWRTIQHAVDQAKPGDKVLVHGGVYNETVMITRSGSAEGGYITLAEAPGERAIIDGAGLVRQPFGMSGLITLADVSYVRVKDFEIRNYKSDSEFIVVGVLVQGAGERIEIRNNVIHQIEANNIPLRGNADGLGIAVYGQTELPLRNVIVDGNELFDLKTGRSEALTIGGNVEGWQVTNNVVRDNNFIGIDATGYYVNGTESDRARRGWIAGNAVYNLSSAENQALTFVAAAVGIYVDGGHDITIERNRVEANDGGIWLLSEHPGKDTSNVIVRNNLVRFNRDAGILVGGYDEVHSGGADNCTIVHNTLFRNNSRDVSGIHSGELQIGHHASDVRFEDNILLAGPKGYVITRFSPAKSSSVTIRHNHYSASPGSDRTRWFWVDRNFYNDGRSGGDFDAFKAASGDEGSVVEEPDVLNVDWSEWRWTAD